MKRLLSQGHQVSFIKQYKTSCGPDGGQTVFLLFKMNVTVIQCLGGEKGARVLRLCVIVFLGSKYKNEAWSLRSFCLWVLFLTAAQCLFNIRGVVSSSLLQLIGSSALWAWPWLELPLGRRPKTGLWNRLLSLCLCVLRVVTFSPLSAISCFGD